MDAAEFRVIDLAAVLLQSREDHAAKRHQRPHVLDRQRGIDRRAVLLPIATYKAAPGNRLRIDLTVWQPRPA